jgi:hypothetical protein
MQTYLSQLLFIITCCLLPFGLMAQQINPDTGFIKNIQKKLDIYSINNPIEQLYVHTDKPYYAVGEDIWFKAYLTSGSSHIPPGISKVINAELINAEDGREVQAIKLEVVSGTAAGDFHLPYTLPAGRYRLKAYTDYIRQTDPQGVFSVDLVITNVGDGQFSKRVAEKPVNRLVQGATNQVSDKLANTADVQFFPEGGTLVNNINSRIAFKVIGPDGQGKDVKGVLLDDKDSVITGVGSLHLGMGSFILFPQSGKHYHALLTFSDSSRKTFTLPDAAQSGYVLTLSRRADGKSLVFRVSVNHGDSADAVSADNVFLVANAGGIIRYATKITMAGSIVTGIIPIDKFPTGIIQLTLFKQNGEPLCERMLFINNHDQLRIALADSITGNRAGRNSGINLRVTTTDGEPVFSSLSAAVIDDHIAPDARAADHDNILSYLLLSSNLTGQIEKPGYYFAVDNEESRNALDLLMLTQGYRHFEWKNVLTGEAAKPVYIPASGIMLTGRVTTTSGKPVPGAKITMYSRATNLLMDTVSNNNGEFSFGSLAFQDSLKVMLTASKPEGSTDVVISLQQPPVANRYPAGIIATAAKTDTAMLPAAFKQNALEQYKQSSKIKTVILNEVKVNSVRKANKASEYSSNLNGPGNADQIIKFDDVALLGPDLPSILNGRIPGVRLDAKGNLISSRAGSFRLSAAMGVIYDGMYLNDGSRSSGPSPLYQIDPLTVESIEVLKSAMYTGIYGSRAANGLLIITSKHGASTNTEKLSNVVATTLYGFYKAREFYIPKYGTKGNNQPTDLRSTIFWKPDVMTDKDGKASFSFLNGVNKSTYRVIIEGFDSEGRLGYQVFKYHVE